MVKTYIKQLSEYFSGIHRSMAKSKYIEKTEDTLFPLKLWDKDGNGFTYIKRLQSSLGLRKDGKFGLKTEEKVKEVIGKSVVELCDLNHIEIDGKADNGKGIAYLVIHCLATPEGSEITPENVEEMHKGLNKSNGKYKYKGRTYDHISHIPNEMLNGKKSRNTVGRGWSQFGYSDLISLDGNVLNLVPYDSDNKVDTWEITNGAKGINSISRHVAYVGGVDRFLKPKDTRTPLQRKALLSYVKEFIKNNPQARVIGHNEVSNKACPSFDVQKWLKEVNLK